ncbi:hypothetical protein [Flagellimonas pacifica]|uniref:Uncharacterized protein n=1 Tax=Flagellimonas pacifica TaxID=1247520 RepID=A0A285MUC4_9FLAO|nr:hypothetical protein [Allomuricauda parva]SNZ00800.1 hypothetical protein SAMN06265377_2626 [Allomuricauda parva]
MDTLAQVHLVSQYLATVGKSFLVPKSDDSHTNVGFFSEDHTLRTWDLDESGTYLAFQYDHFALSWVSKDKNETLTLKGKSHGEIVEWISKMAVESKLSKPYVYDLHYDLPYSPSDDFKFSHPNSEELQKLTNLRTLAQNTLKSFLQKENLKSNIRVWPHHFDTGAFVMLSDGSGKSVGMGMAIPDSIINEHYFYISGYHGHDGIDTSTFKNLALGEWKNDGFKGAILKTSGTTQKIAVNFVEEAFSSYK